VLHNVMQHYHKLLIRPILKIQIWHRHSLLNYFLKLLGWLSRVVAK